MNLAHRVILMGRLQAACEHLSFDDWMIMRARWYAVMDRRDADIAKDVAFVRRSRLQSQPQHS